MGNLCETQPAGSVGHLTSCNDYLLIIYVVYIDAKFTFKARNSLNIKFESYTIKETMWNGVSLPLQKKSC